MSIIEKLSAANIEVAVLCGGPGGEREVSLASGENAHQGLIRAGLPHRKIELPAEHPEEALEKLDCGLALMMLHGTFGEDGAAQRILERRKIAFTGSDSRVCALAMDKNACKKLFVGRGIPTPNWVVTDHPGHAAGEVLARGLRYPLFVKPNGCGSSVGVSRVECREELAPAVEKALALDPLAMVEEMVVGRELTVGWLDGKVLPIIELLADGVFYDYHAKYISNKTRYICPADLPPSMTALVHRHAAAVAELLGVRDSARVDVMLGPDGPMVLEMNTLPGFTPHSLLPMAAAKAGIALEQLCLSLVEMAARRAGIL